MAKKTYYISSIQGKYRNSIKMFSTEEGARSHIYNYALMWWHFVMKDAPVPMDAEEATSIFFYHAKETYTVHSGRVDAPDSDRVLCEGGIRS